VSTKQRPPLWWIKLTQYEYWPWWLLYVPLLPMWLFEALRSGNFRYFMAVNPCMPNSGFYGADKKVILDCIPDQYKPRTLGVSPKEGMEVPESWQFPFIAKPLVGERGKGVKRIENIAQWNQYVTDAAGLGFMIQEYVPWRLEFGILYYRMPGAAKGHITSVTQKEFLHIIGDGQHTIAELTLQKPRAAMQYDRLKPLFDADFWNTIPDLGKVVDLELIGNHCRGTRFINCNYLIDPQLENVFDNIAKNMNGFNYGRYDLRVLSLESLYAGENIRILELNGVDADPAHIYDNQYGLFNSLRDLYRHSHIIGKIARKNLYEQHTVLNTFIKI
jgi:ATP-grasp domain